jgi:hypothetical protein
MRKLRKIASALAAAALLSWTAVSVGRARADVPVYNVAFKTAVTPKALSKNVKNGLAWLAKHQLENGAWGQGDEAASMGRGGEMAAASSVADTAMALLAFMRSGSSPAAGEYRAEVKRGFEYILKEIERSDADSLYVTQTRGTRVQSKIGTYVDTFAALMVLTEAKGTMGDAAANARLEKALDKVLAKIEKNQKADGTWANQGWAPALTQSMAAKGLNRAAQAGEAVGAGTLQRVEAQAQSGYDSKAGAFAPRGDTAGIDLYGAAASSSAMRDAANTRRAQEDELRKKEAEAKTEGEKDRYRQQIAEGRKAQEAAQAAEQTLVKRVEDPAFMRGFGNNGGEEFLSYMLMAETLVVKGGDEWKQWDQAITKLVNGVQNQDGSWTGHHCITGRTFCTAAALLVLMADRTPVPTAAKLRG